MIDLRSDTVTKPSPAMRGAMNRAHVGDDVLGEDPSINRLEAMAAERVGKEAALFVPSGTMGNLAAVMAYCRRGEEILVGDRSHIYHWEAGGVSVLGSVVMQTIATERNGELPLHLLESAVRNVNDSHEAITRLICLETSHNECGGPVLSMDYLDQVRAFALDRGFRMHLDGARLFNAATALGVDAAQICDRFESVMFCLSKGLAAPVGSIVAGPRAMIGRARRVRKMLGGGMRQAGILAAAGIVALNDMVPRLAEDHQNARLIAEGLAKHKGVNIDLNLVQTNIFTFTLDGIPNKAVVDAAKIHGLLLSQTKQQIRAVTHYGISHEDAEEARDILLQVIAALLG